MEHEREKYKLRFEKELQARELEYMHKLERVTIYVHFKDKSEK